MSSRPKDPWIEIGVVARAHGVRGWVRVRLAHAGSSTLSLVREVALGDPSRRVRVLAVEGERGDCRLLLEGVCDRDAADALRGLTLLLPRGAFPPPDDDEVYLADLPGCVVRDAAGALLGTVRAVDAAGPQVLLVVTPGDATGDVVIPFVEGIVTSVDLEARLIHCDPPEGLLEINRPGAARAGAPGDDDPGR